MADIEVVDLRRMLQRRGNKSELEILNTGELGLVEDESKIYFGNNGVNYSVLGESDIADRLNSSDSKKVLSAKQGAVLDSKIKNLELTNTQVNTNVTNLINQKQDTIVYYGDTPPSDTNLIWKIST